MNIIKHIEHTETNYIRDLRVSDVFTLPTGLGS